MNDEHMGILSRGVKAWNKWREKNPRVIPDLSRGNLFGITSKPREPLIKAHVTDLRGVNFSGAEMDRVFLESADLSGAILIEATLSRANLRRVNLSDANLSGADLYEADLYYANLKGANLSDVKLTRAQLVNTNLEGATIENANVFGVAAWDITVNDNTNQNNLIISDPSLTWETPIITDELEVAHFLHLLRRNEKISTVINAVTNKVVLILGRFSNKQKAVLYSIKDALRDRGYVPVIFDFPLSPRRDLTETVILLANLAKFVVADITDAKSIPQELSHVIPNFPSIPVQPTILSSQWEYALFEDWRGFRSVLPEFKYENEPHLIENLDTRIIQPVKDWEENKDEGRQYEKENRRLKEETRRLKKRLKELESEKA